MPSGSLFLKSGSGTLAAEPTRFLRRAASFVYSLAIHAGCAAWLFYGPALSEPASSRVKYTVTMIPLNKGNERIVWFNPKRKLPAVQPLERLPSTRVRPRLRSSQPINAAPKAATGRQFIWIPAPRIRVQSEVRSPNVIAFRAANLPGPPPERPKPKEFRPLPASAAPSRQTLNLPAPEITIAANSQARETRLAVPLKLPAAPFTPPPSATTKPAGAPTLETPADLKLEASGAVPSSGAVNIAVIGLNPADLPRIPLPEGERQDHIAAAPNPNSSGGTGQLASARLKVPGLSVVGDETDIGTARVPLGPGTSPPPPLPRQRMVQPPPPSMSAPFWPNARALNPTIEAKFTGRVVYVTVISPPPGFGSADDWVVWFGERAITPVGTRVFMRPPVPLRTGPRYRNASEDSKAPKVQVAGIMSRDGRLHSLVLLSGAGRLPDAGLLQALEEWDFSPAVRNGSPVEVDVLIEASLPSPLPRAENP
jgi:hypothetical protein